MPAANVRLVEEYFLHTHAGPDDAGSAVEGAVGQSGDSGTTAVRITIADTGGVGYYLVEEPALSEEEERTLGLVMEKLYYSLKPLRNAKKDEILEHVRKGVLEAADELGLSSEVEANLAKLLYYVEREMGYSLIHAPMKDEQVEEVECSGFGKPVTVVHRTHSEYLRLETNISFESEDRLSRFVEKLAERGGRSVNVAAPKQEFMLEEGHRVAVTYRAEITKPGSTFDIRKFPEKPFTITDLLRLGTLSPLMVSYFWVIAEAKRFMLIVGATGSGKTTVLNALLTALNPAAKFVTIEDTPELQLPFSNWVRMFTRPSSYTGVKEVDMAELVKTAMRYRPDYIVVGETRGTELADMVQAVASGHGGLSTFHAADVRDVSARVTGLLPKDLAAEFKQLISAVAITRRLQHGPTGKQIRRVVEVIEPAFQEAGSGSGSGSAFKPNAVFLWDAAADRHYVSSSAAAKPRSKEKEGARAPQTYALVAGESSTGNQFSLGEDGSGERAVGSSEPGREELQLDDDRHVGELLKKSKQLWTAAELLGWSAERLRSELTARTRLLSDMLSEGVSDYSKVAERLSLFYYRSAASPRLARPPQTDGSSPTPGERSP